MSFFRSVFLQSSQAQILNYIPAILMMRRPSSAVISLGRDSEESVPCPNCPRDPPPHEYTRPDSVSMRQCSLPHTTSVTRSRADSGGEGSNSSGDGRLCGVVQLTFTPEIEVFNMPFERCQSKNRESSIGQHTEYFNFRCTIQLDLPVRDAGRVEPEVVVVPARCLD